MHFEHYETVPSSVSEEILKGLKHLWKTDFYTASALGFVIAVVIYLIVRPVAANKELTGETPKQQVNQLFTTPLIFSAALLSFAHGSNDVANAIGPLSAVASIVASGGEISSQAAIAWWILPLGGIGIVIGLATMGEKVMATVGTGITHLTPSRGFAAEMSAADTVVIASGLGLPISTTHTLVGAVLGVGLARGIGALNLRVISGIFASWVITLPAGAGLSILFFYFFKGVFN